MLGVTTCFVSVSTSPPINVCWVWSQSLDGSVIRAKRILVKMRTLTNDCRTLKGAVTKLKKLNSNIMSIMEELKEAKRHVCQANNQCNHVTQSVCITHYLGNAYYPSRFDLIANKKLENLVVTPRTKNSSKLSTLIWILLLLLHSAADWVSPGMARCSHY